MSKKSRTTGILTPELRRVLGKKRISPNVRWNEFESKRGRVYNKIIELPEDFNTILGSPHCWNLLADYDIHNKLSQLEGILSKLGSWHPVPIRRIIVNSQKGKRVFTVKRVTVLNWISDEMTFLRDNFADDSTALKPEERRTRLDDIRKEYFLQKIKKRSRLRPNEWKIILKYYRRIEKINPFHLPLDEGKKYSWYEVKSILMNTNVEMAKIELKTKDEFKESDVIRLKVVTEEAKINKLIDETNEKIKKKGFQYSLPTLVKTDPTKHINFEDIPKEHRIKLQKFEELKKEFRSKLLEIGMTANIKPYFY